MKGVRSFDDDYLRAHERVKEDPRLTEENRQLILDFSDKCFADGLSKGRLRKLLYVVRYLSAFMGKPFKTASKKDVQNVVAQIEKNDKYSDWTKYDFKVIRICLARD